MADLQLLIRLAAADQLLSPLQRNTHALSDFDRQLAKVRQSAENMQSLGRNMGALGVGLVAPIGQSLGAFTDLEGAQVQLKNAMSTLDGLDENWDKINKQAVEAGNLYPGTSADFLRLAAGMKQMGMDSATMASGAFKGATALQVMFRLNPAEAGEAFVQMGKAFQISGRDSLAFADVIQRVSYASGLRLGEIKEAMTYASTGMNQLGIAGLDNAKTVTAMMGVLRQAGVEGSQIGTTFSGAFQHMASLGARLKQGRGEVMREAQEAMAKTGVKLQFFDEKGAFLGMENFINQFDKMKNLSQQQRMMMGQAFFGAEGSRMALVDSGKMREMASRMLQQEDIQKRLARITEALGNKAEAAKGSFTNLAASIGEKLAPYLAPLLDKANSLLGSMQAWTDRHPKLTAAIGGTVGGLGVLALGMGGAFFAVGKIRSTFADGIEAFRSFQGVVSNASGNLKLFREYSSIAGGPLKGLTTMMQDAGGWTGKLGKLLSTDLGPGLSAIRSGFMRMIAPLWGAITATWSFTAALLANPITWIVIGIVALVAAGILLWKNWDKVTAWFKNAWTWFQGLWDKVPGWAKWFMPFIAIPMLVVKHWDTIKGWFRAAWSWLTGLWNKVPDWAKFFVPFIGVPLLIVKHWGTIKAVLGAAWEWVKGFAGRMWDAGKNIVKSIGDGILAAINSPVEAIKKVVAKVREFLPFSPAKTGPLTDIHRIKLVETIADSISPASLVAKMQTVAGAARSALGKGLAVGASVLVGSSPATAGGSARSITIQINVDARGAAPGVQQDIERAILRAAPALKRELERLQGGDTRRKF